MLATRAPDRSPGCTAPAQRCAWMPLAPTRPSQRTNEASPGQAAHNNRLPHLSPSRRRPGPPAARRAGPPPLAPARRSAARHQSPPEAGVGGSSLKHRSKSHIRRGAAAPPARPPGPPARRHRSRGGPLGGQAARGRVLSRGRRGGGAGAGAMAGGRPGGGCAAQRTLGLWVGSSGAASTHPSVCGWGVSARAAVPEPLLPPGAPEPALGLDRCNTSLSLSLPVDVLAAPAPALGLDRCSTSLSLSALCGWTGVNSRGGTRIALKGMQSSKGSVFGGFPSWFP